MAGSFVTALVSDSDVVTVVESLEEGVVVTNRDSAVRNSAGRGKMILFRQLTAAAPVVIIIFPK